MFQAFKKILLISSVVAVQSIVAAQVAVAAPALIPSAPQIAAKGYILIDADSGKVITENNADERLEPASLTKMMTAYVADYEIAQGNISKDDEPKVSENAWAQNKTFKGSSLMWLEVGKTVRVEDLLKGIIISSGNDATVALAEHVAGSSDAFADIMNQHARLLGMKNTHFVNPHGLPHPDHYTTGRDMAILSQAIIRDFPEDYKLYSEKSFKYNNIKQSNRNRLLWRDPSVDGLKTGHTNAAGWCLVSSAKKDGMRLIAVVMGAKSEEGRLRESQKLLSFGFRYYKTLKLYSKGQTVQDVRLWGGAKEQLSLVTKKDVFVTVPRSKKGDVNAAVELDKYIEAPVKKGQNFGNIIVKLDDDVQLTQAVIAKESIETGGFFDGLIDKLEMIVTKLLEE